VSAVRDLFGSVHNEGASKGILVTTSGFGRGSFDFAKDKPLELLSGSNLLYLLKVHADVDAKIEPPQHWAEPRSDSGPAHWDEPDAPLAHPCRRQPDHHREQTHSLDRKSFQRSRVTARDQTR
jgi:hypothetical protein